MMSSTTIFTAGSVILSGKDDTSLQPRGKAGFFVYSGVCPVQRAAVSDLWDNLCCLFALLDSIMPDKLLLQYVSLIYTSFTYPFQNATVKWSVMCIGQSTIFCLVLGPVPLLQQHQWTH